MNGDVRQEKSGREGAVADTITISTNESEANMSEHPGLGVMIRNLCGNNESVNAFLRGVGQEITALELRDDALRFTFVNGYRMKLADEGQSCCEHRYMRTDDDLAYHVGATLVSAEVRDAPPVVYEGEYGEAHEVQFLLVTTSKGVFTMSSHNEHNGYYGGFAIEASAE